MSHLVLGLDLQEILLSAEAVARDAMEDRLVGTRRRIMTFTGRTETTADLGVRRGGIFKTPPPPPGQTETVGRRSEQSGRR